jgi:hypothetical protein
MHFHFENVQAAAGAGARREGRTRNSCAPFNAGAGVEQRKIDVYSQS